MKKALLILTILTVVFTSAAAFAFTSITPDEAYNKVVSSPNVYILDVRTAEEWNWVGHPGANKPGEGAALTSKVVNVSYWVNYKGTLIYKDSFLTDVAGIFGDRTAVVLITMCRSGHRSSLAAAELEAAGFTVYNMATGFEGGTDSKGYRSVNGWKNVGLPYSFSGIGAYGD